MIKDFSVTGEGYFLRLVEQVQEENYNAITDWIGDRWLDFESIMGKLRISNYVDSVNTYHKKVLDRNNTTKETIKKIFQEVREADSLYAGMIDQNVDEHLAEIKRYIQLLGQSLTPTGNVLQDTLIKFALHSCGNALNKRMGNPTFDDKGSYGGNQGSAKENYLDEDLQAIVRKYHPNYSDVQIREFLSGMNKEGCGYVAICNTLFEQFVGREAEFEEKFGFPMYKDGDLNYDALIVDFYCEQDDPNHSGTNQYDREEMWESYLGKRGVYVDVQCDIQVTPETYPSLVKEGALIVSISPVILQNEAGEIVDNRDGGHAMTVTGVTADGRYIVSSWGEIYYVDPNDKYSRFQFQQVKYD